MSSYGPPPGSGQQGGLGPGGPANPNPYGPPPGATGGQSSGGGVSFNVTTIAYGAGALGVLSFIWGFLSWYSFHNQSISGYGVASGGSAAIGLSIVAGGIAAARAYEKKDASAAPAIIAFAALLISLGELVSKGDQGNGLSSGIGLILELITTIVQTVALGYLWMIAVGRMSAPAARPAPTYGASPANPYTPPPPPGYGPPTTQFPQQGGPAPFPTPGAPPTGSPYQSPAGPPSGSYPQQGQPQQGQPQHGQPQPGQAPSFTKDDSGSGDSGATTTWDTSTFRSGQGPAQSPPPSGPHGGDQQHDR